MLSFIQCFECQRTMPITDYRNEIGQKICADCFKSIQQFLSELNNERKIKGQ